MAVSAATRRMSFIAVQIVIMLICVGVTSAIAVGVQERSIREATQERVLAVAHSLAELDSVTDAVTEDREKATAELQPIADLAERSSGVDYVVITDDEGIRITHPTPRERGMPVSTDPSIALAGGVFVGTEPGTLGPTLRAKVPVFRGDVVVGTVSVGIRESEIAADFEEAVTALLPWVLTAILVGSLASGAVTYALDRRVRRMEADVRELAVQRRITGALREQTHEFHTRMHVVRGLVARGDVAEVLAYISDVVPVAGAQGVREQHEDPTFGALLDTVSSQLGALGVSLRIDEQTDVTPGVLGPTDIVVVSNLCRNAAEAGASVVQLMLQANPREVRGSVDDDGPGIAEGFSARVFDRSTTTKVDATGAGRGIGLAIVRDIIVSRQGIIEVSRSSLGGARFTFEMQPSTERGRSEHRDQDLHRR